MHWYLLFFFRVWMLLVSYRLCCFWHSRVMWLMGFFMHLCRVFDFVLVSYILVHRMDLVCWFVLSLRSVLLSLFCYLLVHINMYINLLRVFSDNIVCSCELIWLVHGIFFNFVGLFPKCCCLIWDFCTYYVLFSFFCQVM